MKSARRSLTISVTLGVLNIVAAVLNIVTNHAHGDAVWAWCIAIVAWLCFIFANTVSYYARLTADIYKSLYLLRHGGSDVSR